MRRTSVRAATAAAVGSIVLVGCGSIRPPVCESLDVVRRSVDHVTEANVSENGLSALVDDLKQLKADLSQFAADAKAWDGRG